MIRTVVAGVCFIAGVYCMWLVSRHWLQNPWVILGLFGLGLLLGAVAGVLVGRAIRDRLLRGKQSVFLVIILSLLNFGVLMFLGRPVPTEYTTTRMLIVSALLLVAASFLIALSAYLLGFLLLPGKKGLSRARGLRWIVPLYASILIGAVLGFQSGLWQGGTVPLEPVRVQPDIEPSVTWREVLEKSGSWFPPEITSETKVTTETRPVSLSPPETRSATRETVVLKTSWITPPRHSTVREVIEATGPVVIVGGDRVEFVGYAMLPPDPTGTRSIRGEGSATTYWTPTGEPLKDVLPDVFASGTAWKRNHYTCVLLWNLSPRRAFDEFSSAALTQLPWHLERGGPVRSSASGRAFAIADILRPVPGPAEVRLRSFIGEPNLYTMPAREGATLDIETNRLLVAGLYPWPVRNAPRSSEFSIELNIPTDEELVKEFSGNTYATAVFYCALDFMTRGLRIEAVLGSGGEVSPLTTSFCDHFLVCRYEIELNEIREFRILEVPGTTDIYFSIPVLRGLPPENDGVTNRLDLTYGTLAFGRREDGFDFLTGALGDRFFGQRYSSDLRSPVAPSVETFENATIRDVLNGTYPGRWWVSKGVVCTTGDRFGPIVWKTRWAARKISGGRP